MGMESLFNQVSLDPNHDELIVNYDLNRFRYYTVRIELTLNYTEEHFEMNIRRKYDAILLVNFL